MIIAFIGILACFVILVLFARKPEISLKDVACDTKEELIQAEHIVIEELEEEVNELLPALPHFQTDSITSITITDNGEENR